MRWLVVFLAVFPLLALAGQVEVEPGNVGQTDGTWLTYDNATANWLTWGGVYRGVWFDLEDFFPGATAAVVEQSQFWFYHLSSHPWDTSDFYAELWNGDPSAVTTMLDQTAAVAVHYAPVYVTYSSPVLVEDNFWCFTNTEMSSGGWPSSLGDDAHSSVAHSYYSDTPAFSLSAWAVGGNNCNYFTRVEADEYTSLERTTWGSLKALF